MAVHGGSNFVCRPARCLLVIYVMSNAQPSSVAVLFLCPHCCYLVRAALSMVGRRSACPFCDKSILIPTATNVVKSDAPTWPELPALVTTA